MVIPCVIPIPRCRFAVAAEWAVRFLFQCNGAEGQALVLARQLQLTRVAKVLELLNKIIADSGDPANRPLPRIGPGHAGHPGGIFSLLQNPGGSDPEKTRLLSVVEKDGILNERP